MDKPNRSSDRARPSWFEEMIVEVSTIASTFARTRCRADLAEDIAQDIVLGFIEKFTAGRLTEPPTYLDALVTRMVKQRLIDRERRTAVRAQHEADYVDAMGDNRPAWMMPEDALEEAELDVLHTEILDSLPARRRSAFVLVRQDNLSYKLAGDILGLTPLAICKHVFSAQQFFRERLSCAGIHVTRHQLTAYRARFSAHRHDL
jgi:RNA polymerase sigma factor (sigma-70 family)